jgi:hypothetical protein
MNRQLLPLEAASYLPHSLHSSRCSKVGLDIGGSAPDDTWLPPEQVTLALQNGESRPHGSTRALRARAPGDAEIGIEGTR